MIGIDEGKCRVCGAKVEWTNGRRIRLYCSNACRQKAYRNAKKQEKALQKAEAELAAHYRQVINNWFAVQLEVSEDAKKGAIFDLVYQEIWSKITKTL